MVIITLSLGFRVFAVQGLPVPHGGSAKDRLAGESLRGTQH